jgi:hypothetical protein
VLLAEAIPSGILQESQVGCSRGGQGPVVVPGDPAIRGTSRFITSRLLVLQVSSSSYKNASNVREHNYQSTCSSNRNFTANQYDLEVWSRVDAEQTARKEFCRLNTNYQLSVRPYVGNKVAPCVSSIVPGDFRFFARLMARSQSLSFRSFLWLDATTATKSCARKSLLFSGGSSRSITRRWG